MQVQFVGYKITRSSDQKSIELNGTEFVTNESGGSWWEFLVLKSQPTLIHTVSADNLKAKFEDGKEATYNIHRRMTYSFVNNVVNCKGEGIGTSGQLSNLENYGVTRNGNNFTSQVTSPVIWSANCGARAPVSGEVNVQVSGKAFSLQCTFGTDQAGNPITTGPNTCAYGWRLRWISENKTRQRVISYYNN